MRSGFPPVLTALLEASDPGQQERAWGDFIAVHSGLILHAIRRYGGSHDAVMDRYAFVLEQLKAADCKRLRGWSNDGRSQFGTWLVVVVRRLCHDHYRQRFGRDRADSTDGTEARDRRRRLAELVVDQLDPNLTSEDGGNRDPALVLARNELERLLHDVVTNLAPTDQLLLTLRFRDDLSAPAIARILGMPTPFHVYRRLNHLLDDMRRALGDRGVDGPTP